MAKRHLEKGVVEMNRIRQVLRYRELGLSQREIHRATGLARSTVQEYLGLAEVRGITFKRAEELSDAELRAALGRKTPGRQARCPEPDFKQVHQELHSRKGVTLELLWEEWLESQEHGYSYSVFCRRYKRWALKKKVVLRNAYRGGEFGLCDYTGETLSWFDEKGEEHPVEIFVGVLGASNYTYAEATQSQQLFFWIGSNIRFLEFLGGVPEALIIDNLKSGVTRSCRYEPELNRTYEDFGSHYDTAIVPARARKPRDKGKVEKAVQEVERRILAPLRHHRFRSIAEINEAIRPLLAKLNDREMTEYKASRRELFQTLDQPALRELPGERFIAAHWKSAMVSLDYHIQVEHHYYSVPYWFVRKKVWVKITENFIEIFHDNQRIASHHRSKAAHQFSTCEAHLAPNHLAVRSRTPENFISWGKSIGEQTERLIKCMLDSARHKQLAYRSILGLQRLAKKFGSTSLEAASGIAVERRIYSQRFVRTVLEEEVFGLKRQNDSFAQHANIRGPRYYH